MSETAASALADRIETPGPNRNAWAGLWIYDGPFPRCCSVDRSRMKVY